MTRPPRPSAPAPPAGSTAGTPAARVCVGAITGAHGVRGLVRIKAFTETADGVTAYGAPVDERGRRFSITLQSRTRDQWIARVEGVADRDAARALTGTRLYVDRAALPEPEEEDAYYHADLIGLSAVDRAGAGLGTVRAIWDFGAGDVVEIADEDGRTVIVPFTRAAVPEVDLAGGRLVVDPPEATAAAPADGEPDAPGGLRAPEGASADG